LLGSLWFCMNSHPHNSRAACGWFVTITPHGCTVWTCTLVWTSCQLVSLGCRPEWQLFGMWFFLFASENVSLSLPAVWLGWFVCISRMLKSISKSIL
jgi:hypothetical protein